jgi:hypothetical protein
VSEDGRPEALQDQGARVQARRVARFARKDTLEAFERLASAIDLVEGLPCGSLRAEVGRIELQGLGCPRERGLRVRELCLANSELAEQAHGVARSAFERFEERPSSVHPLSARGEHAAAQVQEVGVVRSEAEGAREVALGRLEIASIEGEHGEQLERLLVVRLCLQGVEVVALRLLELTASMADEASFDTWGHGKHRHASE